ncbi:hypothetical protein ACFE04_020004 [Oxalis oulophora]
MSDSVDESELISSFILKKSRAKPKALARIGEADADADAASCKRSKVSDVNAEPNARVGEADDDDARCKRSKVSDVNVEPNALVREAADADAASCKRTKVTKIKVKMSKSPANGCVGEAGDSSSCKKDKVVTKVNGYIVYTRLKKPKRENVGQLSQCVENERVRSSEKSETTEKDSLKVINVVKDIVPYTQLRESTNCKETLTSEGLGVDTIIDETQLVDVLVVEESPKYGMEGMIMVDSITEEYFLQSLIEDRDLAFEEEKIHELPWFPVKDRVEGKIKFIGKTRLKEELRSVHRTDENEEVSYLDGEANEEDGSALIAMNNNLELKMSKKIALNKKPTTVKELFETGLLEGVTVIYMGGPKATGLRGTIKEAGILCSCSYCKNCRVIPPSQFEIHACKTYKRASQYICFENGKSLLDVMRVCRNSPLHTLEATLQSALSSSPVEKLFLCRRCKGSFPVTCVGRVGPLCNSCVDSKKTEGSSNSFRLSAWSPEPLAISNSSSITLTCMPTENRRQRKISRKSLESRQSSVSSQHKRPLKRQRKSLNLDFGLYSPRSDPAHLSSRKRHKWKTTKKRSKEVSVSSPITSVPSPVSVQNKTQWKITTQDQRLHRLVFEEGGLPEGAEVAYYARGKKLLEGIKKGCGILCCCYCVSLPDIPLGDWYCQYCLSVFENDKFEEHNANAFAAGRVAGEDSIEQITKRCIRIVKNIEAELTGCALCRAHDFSKSGFNPRTILLCDQCEREYHVGCLKTYKRADLKELPKGKWFCCNECHDIHSTLQSMVTNAIMAKHEENDFDFSNRVDVSWRLLSGKIASPETRILLGQAVSIFHECFDPIIDSWSGRDLIPSMVYGRNSRGQEYGGMYCAILIVNSTVVSAGMLRVFGRDFAELPLVATRKANHGKLISYRRSCCQMVTFQGTTMLQKSVPVLDKSRESTDTSGREDQFLEWKRQSSSSYVNFMNSDMAVKY